MADVEDEPACEACSAPITWVEPSFACGLGCTYCTGCAEDLAFTCPACEGTLRREPSRARGAARPDAPRARTGGPSDVPEPS